MTEPVLYTRMELRIRDFERQLQRATRSADRGVGQIENRFAKMNSRLASSFGGFGKGLATSLVGGLSVEAGRQLIDTATRIQNALRVAGLEGAEFAKVYDKLYASAQKNAAPLESLATLYGRVAQNQKELGVSSEQINTFTDKIAVALRVAGTSANQASGALLQLGQALGSGRVQAEEFGSILEGVPTIAQSAARGIKEAEGSVAKLKALVIDGKVSSKAFFDGFIAGSGQMEAQAAKATMTTSQGFTVLTNSLVDAAKRFDTSSEASRRFGDMLGALAGYIDQLSFDSMLEGLDAVSNKLNSMIATVQNWGAAMGDALGTRDFGKWLAGTDFGKAIGAKSDVMLEERMLKGYKVPAADAVVQAWAERNYGGQRTTEKTSRLPPKTKPKTITLEDYELPGAKKSGGSKRQDEYARETAQIRERIALLQAETAAQATVNPLIDDYGFAVEKARAEQELLNAAKATGKQITPELRAEIEQLAASYAGAQAASEGLRKAQGDAKQALADQKVAYEELGQAGVDAFNSLASALEDGKLSGQELVQVLMQVAQQLISMEGLGGILGNLFSGATGGKINFFKPGLYASGGHVRGPGSGTSDSIPAMLSDGEFVVNAKSSKRHRRILEEINKGRDISFLSNGGAVSSGVPAGEAGAEMVLMIGGRA